MWRLAKALELPTIAERTSMRGCLWAGSKLACDGLCLERNQNLFWRNVFVSLRCRQELTVDVEAAVAMGRRRSGDQSEEI
jgi:hypothetical protein